jgi:hypothetical protein
MTENTKPSQGTDWTRLLTDPDLVSHLGTLLQTYREVSPEQREAALLQAMREIKDEAVRTRKAKENLSPNASAAVAKVSETTGTLHGPEPVTVSPPFEPDLLACSSGSDRRNFARLKCYVAVEIRVEGSETPVWGNLSNVSRGGCMVETATEVPTGRALEIGLWVANGKLWVKGMVISGIATRSATSFGVRVKFSEEELMQKEHLREFLKFVENSTRKVRSENSYMEKLKS